MTPEQKLEKPERIAELRPTETLRRIGLGPHDTLADIGAGTGLFALAAAAMTRGTVYALDIKQEMLDIIARRAAQTGRGQSLLRARHGRGLQPAGRRRGRRAAVLGAARGCHHRQAALPLRYCRALKARRTPRHHRVPQARNPHGPMA